MIRPATGRRILERQSTARRCDVAADVVDMLMDEHREVERLLGIMKDKPAQRP